MELLQSTILTPLHPYLSPVITALPQPIHQTLISLLGEKCHSALLLDLDLLTHPECLSLAISKALGIAIITAASIVKIPQLLKLVRSGSSEGLSFTSYALETASFLITLAYNIRSGFPFSTYGEIGLILAQDVVIGALILQYQKKNAAAGAFVASVASAIYVLIVSDTIVNSDQMNYLQAGAGVLSVASKLPQIATVYREGGTGQLSAFAVFNYLAGSLSRIFTTLQEVDDKMILYGFVAGFVLNAILAGQMVYYWNSTTTAKHGGEVDKQGKLAIGQTSPTAALETKEYSKGVKTGSVQSGGSVRRRG